MRKLITFGLIALVSMPVQADIYEQIGVCKKTEDSAKQLECFKALPDNAAVKSGAWSKEIDKSPIDDSRTVIITSEEITANSGKNVLLALRCKEAKPSVFVATKLFFGTPKSEGVPVIVRLDELKAEEQTWGATPDGDVLFNDSPQFIDKLLSHQKLTLRLQDYDKTKHDVIVDLTDLPNQMTEFKESCKTS